MTGVGSKSAVYALSCSEPKCCWLVNLGMINTATRLGPTGDLVSGLLIVLMLAVLRANKIFDGFHENFV